MNSDLINIVRNAVLAALMSALAAGCAWADAADALRAFMRDVKAGRAGFVQTVTSPDGGRSKQSSGRLEFARPNRFRFTYTKPFEQTIVADGQKVWFHDPDLNQVTVRRLGDAVGATPAALLASSSIDKDFELLVQPDRDGLNWVQATPRKRDGTIQTIKVGFQGRLPAVVEIADSFGQRSVLKLLDLVPEASLPAENFRFVVPPGADVSEP